MTCALSVCDVGVRSDEQCSAALNHLVGELPAQHGSTLRHMLAHMCRLCQMQHARGNKEPPTVLVQAMSHVFLRPPWERIMSVPHTAERD